MHRNGLLATILFFSSGLWSAQVADLSGTWHLNVEKSRWGKVQKPVSVVVTINHREPALSYSGRMVYAEGEGTRDFEFNGAIDGREYPVSRSVGDGRLVITRLDRWRLSATFRSNDGQWTETVRTTISRNGRVMTRSIRRKGPDGSLRWTEIYEKR